MSRSRRMLPVERRLAALGLAVCGLLAACTMGPDYRPPEVQVPGQWQPAPPAPVDAEQPPLGPVELLDTAWWAAFGDPKLDALIRVALEENKDLRIAALRVEQYNAQLQVAQAEGGPQAFVRGQRTRDAVSQNRFIPLVAGAYPVGNVYEIGAGVAWEIDFWGRVRRANESALADLMATEEDRRALVLSLVANVASTYVTLLGLDRELELHRLAAVSRHESLQLLGKKLEGGGVGEQPYFKAKAEYEEALAELTVKEAEITVLEYALSSLLGRNPGPDRARQDARGAEPAADPGRPAGRPAGAAARRAPGRAGAGLGQRPDRHRQGAVPADDRPDGAIRLRQRRTQQPDAVVLERQQLRRHPARADLHQRADRRPGARGRGAPAAEGDGLPAERADGLARGRGRAGAAPPDLAALGDPERASSRPCGRTARSALKRYEGGRSSYLEVLDADRSTYVGEVQQNQTRRDQYIALISVYKAMGGGWSVSDSPLAAPTANAKTQ